ncbi:MAG: hypothetical protein BGO23_07275 [Solirubrobacterales bacterium 67-14]|nr:MAG: hypothetical protein BGO23_07275 [Solirubrobacterales bacterium 67-14]
MTVRTQVFRAPMRARSRDEDRFIGARLAVRDGCVGIGEPLSRSPDSLAEALSKTTDEHGERSARLLRRFAQLPDEVLVWTQTGTEEFRLGMIDGPWRYDDSSRAVKTGIHHIRPARWLGGSFDLKRTPRRVVYAFNRGGRNLQRINDSAAAAETERLWAGYPSTPVAS